MDHTAINGASPAETELYASANGAIVQLTDSARVVPLVAATVRLTDQRIVATVGGNDWSWPLADLERVSHGQSAPWSLLAVPGVEDHGVAVPPEDVTTFRAALARVFEGVTVFDLRDRAASEPPLAPPRDSHPTVVAGPVTPMDRPTESLPPVVLSPVAVVDHRPADGALGALAGLEAREISGWFGSHHVLDRVSLMMEPGEVTALIGPSGCGKSTFLRILNRMHEMIPSASLAGEVLLDHDDIYDPQRRVTDARRQIGMVFQKPNPFPAMSIYENVVASFRLTGAKLNNSDQDAVVEETLRKAGLWNEVKDRLRQPGGGLSGGQQQRLCIARALAIRPRVLLMDEPCSALDPTSTRRIEQTIQELADEVTIVIVTHNMQQAARVSHQCAFFLAEQGTPGVIVEHGPTDLMFSNPQDPRTYDYVNGRFG